MDVISASPFFPCSSLLFRRRPDRVSLTAICKATFALSPGESVLALEQEEINTHDVHCEDDPRRSVYAPSDLWPWKPRVDVLLVGHAYAPKSEKARMLSARLKVGEMEKAIDVFASRLLTREGEVREGPRWSKMSLRYEYAAGGADTENPVGVSPSIAPDAYGQRPLPHLQPAGLRPATWRDLFVPTGFGPIAPTWRIRRDLLGGLSEVWSDDAWATTSLEDYSGDFFQVAPRDQQIAELRGSEPITLEYLHPDHPYLTTTLAQVRPRAVIELPSGPPRTLPMLADTLWIDSDRSICTVTWRGEVTLESPDQPGRVVIVMEEAGQALSWANIAKHAGSSPPATKTEEPPAPAQARSEGLPFVSPVSPDRGPTSYPEPPRPLVPPRPRVSETVRPVTAVHPPTWQDATGKEPDGPVQDGLGGSVPRLSGSEALTPKIFPKVPPNPVVPVALEETYLELIWFDPAIAKRLLAVPSWAGLLRAQALDDDERAMVSLVLSRGGIHTSSLEDAVLDGAAQAGTLVGKPVLLAGELQMLFDDVEALRAMIGAASPIARADPRLREVLDFAEEMLKGGLGASPDVITWLRSSLRDTWMETNRGLSPEYLNTHAERTLLERRCYRRRELMDATWIRASWLGPPGAAEVPAYLPATLQRRLPMFSRFPARIVAEPLPRQDQYESHAVALRLLAIGRVVDLGDRRIAGRR